MNSRKNMNAAKGQTQQEQFLQMINEVEKDYHLYFGLKAIQKGLLHPESICDHFRLDNETCAFCFRDESDLPQEIREIILHAYQCIFIKGKE